jgi:glycine/D-amino acid oxidase-like deaminating enzyme
MRVCVVGGGIIGLSTALYLKRNDKSLDITIVTDKITPETTADGAAGIWGIYLLKGTPVEQQRYVKQSLFFHV